MGDGQAGRISAEAHRGTLCLPDGDDCKLLNLKRIFSLSVCWCMSWPVCVHVCVYVHLCVSYPFRHCSSIWVVVMILQHHHSGYDRHPHDYHNTGKVLAWESERERGTD